MLVGTDVLCTFRSVRSLPISHQNIFARMGTKFDILVGQPRRRRNKRPPPWKVDWVPDKLAIGGWYKKPLTFWTISNGSVPNEIDIRRRFLALMIFDFVTRHSSHNLLTLAVCRDVVQSFYGGSCSEEKLRSASVFVQNESQRGRRYHPLTEKHNNGIIFFIPHDLDSVM